MMHRRILGTTAFAVSISPPGRPPRSPAAALVASSTVPAAAPSSTTRMASRSTRGVVSRSSRCVPRPRNAPSRHPAYRTCCRPHPFPSPRHVAHRLIALLAQTPPPPMHHRTRATTAFAAWSEAEPKPSHRTDTNVRGEGKNCLRKRLNINIGTAWMIAAFRGARPSFVACGAGIGWV